MSQQDNHHFHQKMFPLIQKAPHQNHVCVHQKKEFCLNSTIVVEIAYSESSFLSRGVLITPLHGDRTDDNSSDCNTTFS